MKLKKNDLIVHESGSVGTVLKTYLDENKQVYVQTLTDKGLIYGKLEQFRNKDSMLLRCNNCNKESYEDFLEVDTDSQLYKCECGSSTFTPLNISEDFDIEILNY